MKKIIFFIFSFFYSLSISQNNNEIAIAFFESAKIEFENHNYDEVMEFLDKAEDFAKNKKVLLDILFMKAQTEFCCTGVGIEEYSSYTNLERDVSSNYTKALCIDFLKNANFDDIRIEIVAKWLIQMENYRETYSDVIFKENMDLDPKGNIFLSYYLPQSINDSSLILLKLVFDQRPEFAFHSILYYNNLEISPEFGNVKRQESYYGEMADDWKINVSYFKENKKRVTVGDSIIIYNANEVPVQSYFIDHHRGLLSFAALNPSSDKLTYFTYPMTDTRSPVYDLFFSRVDHFNFEPPGNDFGMIEVLSTSREIDNYYDRVFFDSLGMPTTLYRFKKRNSSKEKLKATYVFDKERVYWIKQ